jgi:hypothetical protein
MKRYTRWLPVFAAFIAGGALILSGCGKSEDDEAGGGGGPRRSRDRKTPQAGKVPELKGYGAIKGRIVYNGGQDPEKAVVMKEPTKDQDACPKSVPCEGWYIKNSKDKKGVQYALVFLRPPSGFGMPKISPDAEKLPEKDGKPVEVVTIDQPHCQFEPRVVCLHPKQKIQFINDSNSMGRKGIAHDSKVGNSRNNFAQTMPPDGKVTWDLEASDSEPNQVSCGIHQSTMSAYVWKMTHPYAVVTDAEGNFELKNVPVTEPKMTLVVWHEMLDSKTKEIGPLDAEAGKEKAVPDIAIPK